MNKNILEDSKHSLSKRKHLSLLPCEKYSGSSTGVFRRWSKAIIFRKVCNTWEIFLAFPLWKQINTDSIFFYFLVPDPVSQCYPRKTALGSFWNIGLKPFRLTQEALEDENFLRTALISTLSSYVEEHLGQLQFEIFSKKCQNQLNNVMKTAGNHWH